LIVLTAIFCLMFRPGPSIEWVLLLAQNRGLKVGPVMRALHVAREFVMTRKILFVDDDQYVLNGLERMLWSMRGQWDMRFARSGQEALNLVEEGPVEVIVSDIHMPGMDGDRLLTLMAEKHPRTVRIILSGRSGPETAVQTALPAHQYLSKPCSPERLKSAIDRALKIRDLVEDDSVQAMVARIGSLPALPELYRQVTGELSATHPSLKRIGKIISQDQGMCTKLLNLVNSPFFGFSRHVSSPEHAVTLLGVNILRALLLSLHVFSLHDLSRIPGFSVNNFWEHSLTTGKLAEKVGRMEGLSAQEADDCYMGGLLHDVGKLLLAGQLPVQYRTVLEKVRRDNLSLHGVELEILGTTHAEIGAHLTGLWGLADPVVEAVAFHHAPSVPFKGFRALTAVHVANILERKYFIVNPGYTTPDFDIQYLEDLSLAHRLPAWKNLALKQGRAAIARKAAQP